MSERTLGTLADEDAHLQTYISCISHPADPQSGCGGWRGRAYLQRDVLQQRVLQHRLQLAVDLQRQVQGEAAVGRVRGVERRHDAPPPAQVGLVDVGRL